MKPYKTNDVDGKEANEFYPYKKDNYGNGVYTTKTAFKVTEIGYTEDNKINRLTIADHKGNKRFSLVPVEEQEEILNLTVELNDLVRDKNYSFEKIHKHYKVESTQELSIEQLKDAVEKLKGMKVA
jgi:hypothetical protein